MNGSGDSSRPPSANFSAALRSTNRHLVAYFVLAYAFSWCAFVPLALDAQGLIAGVPGWLHVLGAYGPLLAAFVVTGATGGRAAVAELLRRMGWWRVGAKWLAVALLSPLALYLVGMLVAGLVAGGDWSGLWQYGGYREFPQLNWLAGWLVWTLTFGLGEETGWRGFALPRLQANRSASRATLILGLLWAGWHLPTFFYNYELSLFSVAAFTIGILSGAVVLTWLYNSTRGSVLVAILWHGAYNAAAAGDQALISAVVTAAVILGAVAIGNYYGPATFSREPRQVLLDVPRAERPARR